MKTLIKHVLPQTGLFTIVFILISAFYNIIENSSEKPLFIKLIIFIACGFFLSCMEFYLYTRRHFQNYYILLTISVLTWYIGIGGGMILTGWMHFNLSNLLQYTVEFALVYLGFLFYNSYRLKKDAEEINEALAKRNTRSL